MKFYSERATFRGSINKKSVNDLKNMNFGLENSHERLECVNKILEECDPLIHGYLDDYYKVNTTNELSDDINIFKNIEMLGTYLLNSKDLPTESKQEYKIYTDEELFIKATKENEGDYENAIAFLKNNVRNEYIVKPIAVTEEDFDDERLREYLKCYQNMAIYIKNQLSAARRGEKIQIKNIKLGKKIAKEIKDDMNLLKEKIVQPIKLPCNGDFSQKVDWDQFNYRDGEHIKAMLYMNKDNILPDDDVSLIKHDINYAINDLYNNNKLKSRDMIILDMIKRNKSFTFEDIGYEIGTSKQYVNNRLNVIVDRIVDYFIKKNF